MKILSIPPYFAVVLTTAFQHSGQNFLKDSRHPTYIQAEMNQLLL